MENFCKRFAVFLFFTINVFSQAKDSLKVIFSDEVVVTAQYMPQSEYNAMYKLKLITAKEIESKTVNNLRELLQQEALIDLSQKSVFGTSIELQGIPRENVKILMDGIPVIGRLDGQIDLNQINLNNIERIEIIEGPVSVFYGTDAMGGVINLISKNLDSDNSKIKISTYFEDINAKNYNAHFTFPLGQNRFYFGAGFYQFDGLSTDTAIRKLNWEKRNQAFADFKYLRRFKKMQFSYTINYSKEKLFSLGEANKSRIKDIDYHTKRLNQLINFNAYIEANKFIDMTAFYSTYNRFHETYAVDKTTYLRKLAKDVSKDEVIFRNLGLRAQFGKSDIFAKLDYAFGFNMNKEYTEGDRILNHKQVISTFAFFSSLNYKLSNYFEIQPSARYTLNSAYSSLFSPAVNLKFRIKDNHVIRFSYARGFRAPSLKELFLNFHISKGPFTYTITGNKGLSVEKSHGFNFYYTYSKILDRQSKLEIEPSFFYNDISNLITLSEMLNFKRYYINIRNFKSTGRKLAATFKSSKNFSVTASFAYIGRFNEYENGFTSKKFLYTPEITFSTHYTIRELSNLNLNIYYKFSGERVGHRVEIVKKISTLIKTKRASFTNINISASKLFFDKVLNISIGVKNLKNLKDIQMLNEKGQAHGRDLQLWGRSYFIKASVNF